MDILKELIFAFWFFGPVGLANLGAFLSAKIPGLKKLSYPIDFNLKFRGKRIFGSHKTIRGFITGIAIGIITVSFQIYAYNRSAFLQGIMPIDYSVIDPVIFGFLCGFGALAGDAIKSFFKRQISIFPGQSWFPFDQTDYIIGGILFTWIYIPLDFVQYMFILIIWFLLHPFTSFIGYLLRLKRKPL